MGDRRALHRDRGRLRPAGPRLGHARGQRPDRPGRRRREPAGQGRPDALRHRRLDLPQRRRAGRGEPRLRPARRRAPQGRLRSRPSPKPPTPATRWRRPRPRTTASSRCASPGVISQSAADDSALQLQIAKGNATKAESAVLSARAALAGNPDIATDRHPEVLAGLRQAPRRRDRPAAHRGRRPGRRRHQPDRPPPAGPVRDARRHRPQPRRHRQELDRGELQGDRAHPHDAGPARRGHHRHLRRPRPEGRARLDRRRHRRGVRAASRRRTPPATGSRSSSASRSASPSTPARTCRRCAPA